MTRAPKDPEAKSYRQVARRWVASEMIGRRRYMDEGAAAIERLRSALQQVEAAEPATEDAAGLRGMIEDLRRIARDALGGPYVVPAAGTGAIAPPTRAVEEEQTISEELRRSAEWGRDEAEQLRAEAERTRAGAESHRMASERERTIAEAERASGEQDRDSAESAREAAELLRITAEASREAMVEQERIVQQMRETLERMERFGGRSKG